MTVALSWFEGEPGLPIDPATRWPARSNLWEELARLSVDVDMFDARLRSLLRPFYEAEQVARAFEPQVNEADHLHRVARDLGRAAHHCTQRLPIRAQAAVGLLAVRMGHDWHAMRERVQHDAETMRALLAAVESDMRATPARAGRKPKTARDATLRAVAKELTRWGIKRTIADPLALRVLQVEGIAAPAPDQRQPGRAVRRATKSGHK